MTIFFKDWFEKEKKHEPTICLKRHSFFPFLKPIVLLRGLELSHEGKRLSARETAASLPLSGRGAERASGLSAGGKPPIFLGKKAWFIWIEDVQIN